MHACVFPEDLYLLHSYENLFLYDIKKLHKSNSNVNLKDGMTMHNFLLYYIYVYRECFHHHAYPLSCNTARVILEMGSCPSKKDVMISF